MTRILCLHGAGTNAKIFGWQLAFLKRGLGPDTELFHMEGEVSCDAAPGLEGVAPPPFLCYHESVTIRDVGAALEELVMVIEEDGPFDGVVGFSQGSALAASMLLAQSVSKSFERAPFNFALFFSGITPFSADTSLYLERIAELMGPKSDSQMGVATALEDAKADMRRLALSPIEGTPMAATMLKALDADPMSDDSCRPYHAAWTDARINIPTLHIFGETDPFRDQARSLYDLCSTTERTMLEHPGGHDVPRDGPSVAKSIKMATELMERSKLVANGSLF